jgi:hypothetical protein
MGGLTIVIVVHGRQHVIVILTKVLSFTIDEIIVGKSFPS